ncbi:hypothetical protein GQ53DRAFT_792608 [Thozetella sp. PMI_491]|nr:hypothetical protein GQ53DRAFT_792608 [Thozetella sp. PMI_491]
MLLTTFTCLLSLAGGIHSAALGKRDDTLEGVTIYAYGDNISGLPIYAGANGTAYIADSTADLIPLSWNITGGGSAPWNVTANETSDFADLSQFYIVTSDNAYEPAGFVPPNGTIPDGAEVLGFATYGTFVMFLSGSNYLSQFWAQTSDTDGVWTLKWNQDGSSQDDSVAVTLKLTPPSTS